MDKIDIAGLKIDVISKQEFLDAALNRIKGGQKTFVTTPYSEFLYHGFENSRLLKTFNAADFAVADGIGIFWARRYLELPLTSKSYRGKILQALWQISYSLAAIIFYPKWIKSALPEKIVGADLIWDLTKMAAENNLSIYLLGGFADTTKLAVNALMESSAGRLKVAGYSNGDPHDPLVINDINRTQPDILLVAFGPVRQEQWIYENLSKLDTRLAIGVGGTFDYIAGKKSQPPKFIRYNGLEWLWRLITQPYRIKRIFNATFGLMSGLWHYKVFNSLPFRPNVAIVILNSNNQVLACERNPRHFEIITSRLGKDHLGYWQFPQGGIDGQESIVKAAEREAKEEVGIDKISLLYISKKTYSYMWNNALRRFLKTRSRYKGQNQHIAYFKFTDHDNRIKVDQNEFINWKWIPVEQLENVIHPEHHELVKIVLEDLKEMREKVIL